MSPLGEVLVAEPGGGARYRTEMRVRLADADPSGRMRFDALARFLQDVSTEDTERSEEHAGLIWVARRVTFDVVRFPVYREVLDLRTWCGGLGSRWAERRVSMRGDRGGHVEASTLWVLIDRSGAPTKLPESLVATLRETAGDRRVSARLSLAGPPESLAGGGAPWVVRRCDLDLMGHVNNAGLWAMAEEDLGDLAVSPPSPLRAEIEFPREVLATDALRLVRTVDDEIRHWWLVGADGVHTAAALRPGPGVAERWEPAAALE